MDAVNSYFLQNWPLILILIAFAVVIKITVFTDKKNTIQLYTLIGMVFLLSIVVFTEFYLGDKNILPDVRIVFMAIRYSATPIIIGMTLLTLVKRSHWWVILPSLGFAIINVISIFTGIVFSLDAEGNLVRGVLGYLPYIASGLYAAALIVLLFMQNKKQFSEIVATIFLAFALLSGIVFPFILGKDYSKIFVTIIAISLFVYYIFQFLYLTKRDALTGLLNRQAYYAYIRDNQKDITAFITIDMNGLKVINDTGGHQAGDTALITLGYCFAKAAKYRQSVYRMGGDEFVIVCKKTSKEELEQLINRIKENVSKTRYTCSIGYSLNEDGKKTVEEMVKESDEMMYQDKAEYYRVNNLKRRHE